MSLIILTYIFRIRSHSITVYKFCFFLYHITFNMLQWYYDNVIYRFKLECMGLSTCTY